MFQFVQDKDTGHHKSCKVCHRSGKQDSIDSHKDGENQKERDQEDHLTSHGQKKSFQWFANGCKEVGGDQLHTVDNHHEKKNTHKAHSKFIVGSISASKQGKDLSGEELESAEAQSRNNEITFDGKPVGFFNSAIFPGSIVKTDDRLCSLRNSDDYCQ